MGGPILGRASAWVSSEYPLQSLSNTSLYSTSFVCAFDRALLYAGY
jgi:hypothetical protein